MILDIKQGTQSLSELTYDNAVDYTVRLLAVMVGEALLNQSIMLQHHTWLTDALF